LWGTAALGWAGLLTQGPERIELLVVVQRFHLGHHPCQVLTDGQIAAHQFLQSSHSVFTVINRLELVAAQQIRQLPSVDPVVLVPRLEQSISAWITYHNVRDVRLEQVVQPRRAGSFFQGHLHASPKSTDKLQDACCFRLDDGLHDQLAGGIQNHRRDRCLVNIEPNILGVIHEGAPSRRC